MNCQQILEYENSKRYTMDILQPEIRFNITAASRVLPDSPPISNLEILHNFPRTADKPLSFLEKFAEKIGEEFGFYSRYWCHKPWESMDKSRELTAESLATLATQKLFTDNASKKIHAFLLGSTTNKRFTGSQAAAVLGTFRIRRSCLRFKNRLLHLIIYFTSCLCLNGPWLR